MIKIAKNELRNLFFSPVAWFLLIMFLIMCGYFYTGIMYPLAKETDHLIRQDPNWIYLPTLSITANIFQPFFAALLPNMYLFVPLLTMSVVSREFNNGTIKLLYSCPITLNRIVLGKYLAMMIYNFAVMLVLGIFIVSGAFDIKSLDYPPLLSAILGFYLLLCSLTAIGFFMSSLTTYPIVSAIASFTVLFILMTIGGLWQQYDLVRDLTWFLSVRDRTEKMMVGLITTKDVIYYLVIMYMFVGFTILKLKAGRETKPAYIKTIRHVTVVASGLLIGYISSRPGFIGYWDTTALKTNTLHPRTQKILREMRDSTLEVTLYVNLLDHNTPGQWLPKTRNIYMDIWEPYIRYKPNITLKYEYYYDLLPGDSSYYKQFPGKTLRQIAGLMAKGYQVNAAIFKSPEEMHKLTDLKQEAYVMVMQLKYKGRTTFLRFLPSQTGMNFDEGSTEPNIIASLARLTGVKMPRVAFVSGELERNIYKRGEREYNMHAIGNNGDQTYIKRIALTNLGFDVDTLNLAAQDIPGDLAILVLADPKMELSPAVLDKLRAYIVKGGNMLILGEPGKQYVLNPLLQSLGVRLAGGQLVQPNHDETADLVSTYWTRNYLNLAEEYEFLLWKHLLDHKVQAYPPVIRLRGITTIDHVIDSGFTIRPLLMTASGKAWLKAGRLVADSVAPVFKHEEGDLNGDAFPVAVQLTRQRPSKEQRIVVYGDADIASNTGLITDLVYSIYSWLDYNEFPAYTNVPYARDNRVTITPGRAAGQKIIYIWVLPGILLVSGAVLLLRRRRK
ncbi:MAG: Gldg family protein [Chitinophagaceae bacterium]|nr:Gldg family protein [Chitinophagaceae bacterium]